MRRDLHAVQHMHSTSCALSGRLAHPLQHIYIGCDHCMTSLLFRHASLIPDMPRFFRELLWPPDAYR